MKAPKRTNNPVLIIGALLAVATGLASYYLTDFKQVLGFVAGLQVTVIALQVESLLRDRRNEAVVTRQHRMVKNIEAVPWMPDVVSRMAESTTAVQNRFPNTAVSAAARRLFEDCATELRHLELGHLWFDYEEIGMLLDQAAQAQTRIRATSLQEIDLEWWLSPLGRKYWQVLLEAMARGVICERIFIYSEWTPALDRLAREQATAGVRVLRVHRSDLPARLRIDIIVWDQQCALGTKQNDRGEGQRTVFTLQPEEVNRMADLYDSIYNCADEWTGGEAVASGVNNEGSI